MKKEELIKELEKIRDENKVLKKEVDSAIKMYFNSQEENLSLRAEIFNIASESNNNDTLKVEYSSLSQNEIQGHREPSKVFKGYKETVLDLHIPQSKLEAFCKMKTLEIKGINTSGKYRVGIEVVEYM